jgi:hypothetical protein
MGSLRFSLRLSSPSPIVVAVGGNCQGRTTRLACQESYFWQEDGVVDEFVCLTVRSAAGEAAGDFSALLSRFWTHMLRSRPDEFESVYAETTAFENEDGRLTRKYALKEDVLTLLETELTSAGVEFEPVDRSEVYTKYETAAPEWMQIEH